MSIFRCGLKMNKLRYIQTKTYDNLSTLNTFDNAKVHVVYCNFLTYMCNVKTCCVFLTHDIKTYCNVPQRQCQGLMYFTYNLKSSILILFFKVFLTSSHILCSLEALQPISLHVDTIHTPYI